MRNSVPGPGSPLVDGTPNELEVPLRVSSLVAPVTHSPVRAFRRPFLNVSLSGHWNLLPRCVSARKTCLFRAARMTSSALDVSSAIFIEAHFSGDRRSSMPQNAFRSDVRSVWYDQSACRTICRQTGGKRLEARSAINSGRATKREGVPQDAEARSLRLVDILIERLRLIVEKRVERLCRGL